MVLLQCIKNYIKKYLLCSTLIMNDEEKKIRMIDGSKVIRKVE